LLKTAISPAWIGGGAINPTEATPHNFVWMDVPLHSGSVVVPADAYAWIKGVVLADDGLLDIAGMYREQFSGYHNRGYFEGIQIPLNEE
jgi:hypothetical protein